MGNEADNKFTWVIKNFLSLGSEKIYSDSFVIGGCKWHLMAYPKGDRDHSYLALYLVVSGAKDLPCGWSTHATYHLNVVNQHSNKFFKAVRKNWFDQMFTAWGVSSMFPLAKLRAKDSGFLVNGELKIVAEVDVVEVIGKLDVSDETKETTNPRKKLKLDDNDAVSSDVITTTQLNESVDVNGFQVLPSQVESVKRIFERHPDFASKFFPQNRHLKSTYINVLLGIIETICQSPQELSDDDLYEASFAISYVESGGFKVDWLEKKLVDVKEKKQKVETGKARLQQMEEELHKLNQRSLDLKVLLEKENTDVLAANVPYSFDDVV